MNIPIVCDLDAIPSEERAAHEARAKRLFYDGTFTDLREVDSGYEFAFPLDELLNVATYIKNERLCCPFWDFRLTLAPNEQVFWLHLGGADGVKAMMQQEIIPQTRQSDI